MILIIIIIVKIFHMYCMHVHMYLVYAIKFLSL